MSLRQSIALLGIGFCVCLIWWSSLQTQPVQYVLCYVMVRIFLHFKMLDLEYKDMQKT